MLVALLLPAVVYGQGASDKEGTVKVFLKRATEAYRAGDLKQAAALYHRLYLLAPDRPTSLYNAARIEEKMGELKLAARHYGEFLTVTRKSHPKHALGKARFDAVHAKLEAARAKAEMEKVKREAEKVELRDKATAPPPSQAPRPPATEAKKAHREEPAGAWKRPAGWAGLVAGALSLAGAGALLYIASSDKTELDDTLQDAKDKYGNPYHEVPAETARERQDAIDLKNTLGLSAVIGGAVFVGAGVWMLATAPDKAAVAVVPTRDGAAIAAAWRF